MHEVVFVDCIVQLSIFNDDSLVHTCFAVVNSISLDVLSETSFIHGLIGGIFPSEWKIVPQISRPVTILSTQKKIITILTDTRIKHVNTMLITHISMDEYFLRRAADQATILAFLQAAVLVIYHCAVFMMIATYGNVAERWCCMTTRGFVEILPGKPFYVSIMILTTNTINLLKFMMVVSALNAPRCIIHVRDDAPSTMGVVVWAGCIVT